MKSVSSADSSTFLMLASTATEKKECEAQAIGKPGGEGFHFESGFPLVDILKRSVTPKDVNCVAGHRGRLHGRL